jgi:hypothetical protein
VCVSGDKESAFSGMSKLPCRSLRYTTLIKANLYMKS